MLCLILGHLNRINGQTNSVCISLHGSQACQNFSQASVSTSLNAEFPFLEFVSTVQDFDAQFLQFIQQSYTKLFPPFAELTTRKKYQETMQCQGIDLMNTSYLYARFTQTVLCAQMVQESIQPCGLSQQDAYAPLSEND